MGVSERRFRVSVSEPILPDFDRSAHSVEFCRVAVTKRVKPHASRFSDPDPGMTDGQVVSELLKPYDAALMRSYPVSTRVNHVANDDEECSRPVVITDTQNRLFA